MNIFDKVKKIKQDQIDAKRRDEEYRKKAHQDWVAKSVDRARDAIPSFEKCIEDRAKEGYSDFCVNITDFYEEGRQYLKEYFTDQGFGVKIEFSPAYSDSEWSSPDMYTMTVSW